MAMTKQKAKFTCGKGLLKPLLARLRARQANRLIPGSLRKGRILDIGCGYYPYFLTHTSLYKGKVCHLPTLSGEKGPSNRGIRWHTLNLNGEPHLPLED